MNYNEQITYALDKDVQNVAFLAYFPESKLDKKLLSLKQQLAIAVKNKLTDAAQLLQIWQRQVLDAKILKAQWRVEDNPTLELKMFLPEIDAFEEIEKRQERLKQKLLKDSAADTKVGERFRGR
jgi:hypothetical protein